MKRLIATVLLLAALAAPLTTTAGAKGLDDPNVEGNVLIAPMISDCLVTNADSHFRGAHEQDPLWTHTGANAHLLNCALLMGLTNFGIRHIRSKTIREIGAGLQLYSNVAGTARSSKTLGFFTHITLAF